MSYIIGIDGGGTKTTCLFNKLGSFTYPDSENALIVTGEGTNPQSIGYEVMKQRFSALLTNGLSAYHISPSEIFAVSCGFAGLGRTEDINKATKIIKEVFLELHFSENLLLSVHSDSFIALHGSLPANKTEGILVIAGTGSNSLGITDAGESFRSGGWGHVLGDEGSGYQIALQALQYTTKAFDQRAAPTLLTEKILQFMQWDHLMEIRDYIYQYHPDKNEIAAFARLVIEAAEENDAASVHILQNAARELVLHVESLHRQSSSFHQETPIMVTGSIIENAAMIMNDFKQQIEEKKLGIVYPSRSSPAYGACLLAEQLLHNNRKVR